MRRNALLTQASLGDPQSAPSALWAPGAVSGRDRRCDQPSRTYPRQPASASSVASRSAFAIPPRHGEVVPLSA